MLGRKNDTQKELDQSRAVVGQQLAAYKALVTAVGTTADKKVDSALDAFEVLFFNNMVLVLDRFFVHRLRMVTGKDGNPLNEVELLSDSLMNNQGILRGRKVITLVPDQSVLKLNVGDPIRITGADFERRSAAFFAEIERKFL